MQESPQPQIHLAGRVTIRTHSLHTVLISCDTPKEAHSNVFIIWNLFIGNPHKREVIVSLQCTINRIEGSHYTLLEQVVQAKIAQILNVVLKEM